MARSLQVDWQDDADALRECYERQRDRQDRTRVHLLWLLRKGHSMSEAAEAVGVGYRTAGRWVDWYRAGGLGEVLSRRHGGSGGREARLSKSQEQTLLEKARAGEVRTIWDGVEWARSEAGVDYTYWGMRHVFERLGMMGQTRRVWAPAGFEVVQQKQVGYQYEYLNLAVNPMTGELKWDWTCDMKSASLSSVVESWQESVEALVWDGAPRKTSLGHRGSAYEEVGVERIQQPPYSPELQPAERVFEYVRARVEGIVYEQIENKKAAVEEALRKLAACKRRVKRLTGWSWIRRSITEARLLNTPLL